MIWCTSKKKTDSVLVHAGTNNKKEYLEAIMTDPNVTVNNFENAMVEYQKLYGLRTFQKFIEDNGLLEYFKSLYNTEKFLKEHLPTDAVSGMRKAKLVRW